MVLAGEWLFELRRVAVLRAAGFPRGSAHYGIAAAVEWLVLDFVYWGLVARDFIEAVMGPRWKSIREVVKESDIALLFWNGSAVVLTIVGALLKWLPNGPGAKFILPARGREMSGWVALSVSAGICEGATFRD